MAPLAASSTAPPRPPAAAPPRVLARTVDSIGRNARDPSVVLPIVLIAAFAARAVWLNSPQGSLIFDETYYVNAARTILGIQVPPGAPYAGSPLGLDPNTEHPPLGKVLIAASMSVFGDNGLGWRLPSLFAGMTALVAIYLIVRANGEAVWLAILVVAFVAFDNLSLVHSRIGTLDMLALGPMLVGAWLALRGGWLLAGSVLGLAFLVKETAVYGLLAVLVLLGIGLWSSWRQHHRLVRRELRPIASVVLAFAFVASAGLWLLDARFTSFANPLDHLQHIVQYGVTLQGSSDRSGICTGVDSAPWQWPFNECQINYLRVDTTVQSGGTSVTQAVIDFRGALNPLLAAAIPLAMLFLAWFAWRTRDRLAIWALAWAGATYLPYVAVALTSNRIMYIYYFLPVIPAVAIAVAVLLLRSGLPRFVAWGYVVAYAVGFAAYFPFRQIPP